MQTNSLAVEKEAFNKYAGKNRLVTSYNIAEATYPDGCENIILASGIEFADSLSAVSLSKKYKAPIILTLNTDITSQQADINTIISKLGVKKIYIVGGTGSVAQSIVNGLSVKNITRISGINRYETNKAVIEATGFTDFSKVVVANGGNFPDAISIGAYAYENNVPLLLSSPNMSNDTFNYIVSKSPKDITLVGGTTEVDTTGKLASKFGSGRVKRLAGKNRYETNKIVYDTFYGSEESIIIASGTVFADALSAVPLAGKYNTHIALVPGDLYSNPTSYIDNIYSKHIVSGAIDYDTKEVIYINPHQDDESLAFGYDIIKDVEKGKKITFIQVTNGGGSGAYIELDIKQQQMVDSRNAELKYALQEYGLKESNIIYMELINNPSNIKEVEAVIKDLNELLNKQDWDEQEAGKIERAIEILEESVEKTVEKAKVTSDENVELAVDPFENEEMMNMPESVTNVINTAKVKVSAEGIKEYRNKITAVVDGIVAGKDTTNIEVKTLLADLNNDTNGAFAEHYACNLAARKTMRKYNTKFTSYVFNVLNKPKSSDFSPRVEVAIGTYASKWRKGLGRYEKSTTNSALGIKGVGYKSAGPLFNIRFNEYNKTGKLTQYKYLMYKQPDLSNPYALESELE